VDSISLVAEILSLCTERPCVYVLTHSCLNSQLMLYREINSVYFQIHTEHINTLCGQNWNLAMLNQAVRGEAEVHPVTYREGTKWRGEVIEVYIHSFFNLGIRRGWVSTPRPGRFTPGKDTRYPLYRRLRGPRGRSERLRKISPTPRFEPLFVKPVDSHCTDTSLTITNSTFCPQCIYVFCLDMRTNSDYFPTQY